jgi:hypothetical protein
MDAKLRFGLHRNIQGETGRPLRRTTIRWRWPGWPGDPGFDSVWIPDRAETAHLGVDHVVIQPMPPIEGTRFFGARIIRHYL